MGVARQQQHVLINDSQESRLMFPTGAHWSRYAPRCIAKGSAGDDITNKKKRTWGPLDRQNEIDRTNEYT